LADTLKADCQIFRIIWMKAYVQAVSTSESWVSLRVDSVELSVTPRDLVYAKHNQPVRLELVNQR
jgi:hypothetical protein